MRLSNPLLLLRRVVALVTGCFLPPGNDQLDETSPSSAQPAAKPFRNSYDTGTTAAPPDPAPTDSHPPKAVDTLLVVPGDVGRDTRRPSSSDGRVGEYFAPHDSDALITASAPDLHADPSPSDALAPEVDVDARSKSTDALPTREDSLPISIDSTDSGTPKGTGAGGVKTGTTTSSGTIKGRPGGGVVKQKQ